MKTPVKPAKDGVIVSLYVQPGASKTQWVGLSGQSLKLRIAARPIEGLANQEVCSFIARFAGVPKSSVTIVHGEKGRNKSVAINGDPSRLQALFATLIEDQGT